jgi:hypothetical protein
MKNIKSQLRKRRKIALIVIWILALLALFFDYFYGFTPVSYISSEYRSYAVAFLLIYKLIELFLFYLFLYRKNYIKLIEKNFDIEMLSTFKKRSKQFFFLVPQGSVVFGVIAYKITGIVWFVPLFVVIASITMIMVNPQKLRET